MRPSSRARLDPPCFQVKALCGDVVTLVKTFGAGSITVGQSTSLTFVPSTRMPAVHPPA